MRRALLSIAFVTAKLGTGKTKLLLEPIMAAARAVALATAVK